MLDMQQCPMFLSSQSKTKDELITVDEQTIQQLINSMATKMRTQHQPGCFYLEAINDFISAHAD